MKPVQFKQAFVTMSSYVHQLTNMTGTFGFIEKAHTLSNALVS